MTLEREERSASKDDRLKVGSVSFFPTRPLIYGLDADDSIELSLDIPSKLLDGLTAIALM